MLASRGCHSRALRPANALRQSAITRAQNISPTTQAYRQYSQSRLARSSARGVLATADVLTRTNLRPSTSSASIGAGPSRTSTVFSQTSGATRALSISSWLWASKPEAPAEGAVGIASTPQVTSTAQPPSVTGGSAGSPTPATDTASQAALPPYSDPISQSVAPEAFNDLDIPSVLDIPEQIGYLKHLGLEFGWGPTSSMEWLLEHVYIYTGMPWWASIAAVAIALRVGMFLPSMRPAQSAAIHQRVRSTPEFIEAQASLQAAAYGSRDTAELMQARMKMSSIIKKSGGSTLKAFLPPLLILPFSLGMFRLLRSMAALPVPSLETGGFLWFTDMTIPDPLYILPLGASALGAVMMSLTQKGQVSKTPGTEAMQKFILYGLTPLTFFITIWMPAAVQWFFLCFSVTSAAQAQINLIPSVRRFFDLPPLMNEQNSATSVAAKGVAGAAVPTWQAPSTPKSSGLQGMIQSFNKNVESMKAGVEEMASTMGGTAPKAEQRKAQDYEERRAKEEREKAFMRNEERRRAKLLKQQQRRQ